MNSTCTICNNKVHPLIDEVLDVTYDVCNSCGFIYKQPLYHLSKEDEKKRYLKHHNDDDNIGYKTYLKSFMKESILTMENVQTILDFGSGPNPILKKLLQNEGYEVDDYDPFFNDDQQYKDKKYDLIVLTEVLEHVFSPIQVLEELKNCLNVGGRLLIMTQFRNMSEQDFLNWWYHRDTTHVGFYNYKTFQAIAKMLDLKIISTNKIDRIILTK
jgi:SAM-dependent methyltransferase